MNLSHSPSGRVETGCFEGEPAADTFRDSLELSEISSAGVNNCVNKGETRSLDLIGDHLRAVRSGVETIDIRDLQYLQETPASPGGNGDESIWRNGRRLFIG